MKSFVCPNCGGTLTIYSYGNHAKCPYCGTQVQLEHERTSWKEGNYSNTRVCPVCRGDGSLVLNAKKTLWRCLNCGYQITPSELETEVFWFCDECDAFLNVQPGFDDRVSNQWKCKQCGCENDVSDENIFD